MYRAQFRVRTQQALTAPRRSEFSMNSVENIYAQERARRNPYPSYRTQERQRAIEDQNRWHNNLAPIVLAQPNHGKTWVLEDTVVEERELTRMEKRLKSLIDAAEVAADPVNKFTIARLATTVFMHLARKWRDR